MGMFTDVKRLSCSGAECKGQTCVQVWMNFFMFY